MIDFFLRYGMHPNGKVTSHPSDHPLQRAPKPELAVNDTPLPANWGVRCYELMPGRNTLNCSLTLPNDEGTPVTATMRHPPYHGPDRLYRFQTDARGFTDHW